MNITTFEFTVSLVVSCTLFYWAGFWRGMHTGKDEGWIERQLELWRDERNRREANGRFKKQT